jgi:hypothetical protein
MSINSAPMMAATVVAVDVGKTTAALSVTDAGRHRLLGPINFAMTAAAVSAVLDRVCGVLPAAAVKVGVEAAGHYHRPLSAPGVGSAPGEDRRDRFGGDHRVGAGRPWGAGDGSDGGGY